ncbi:DGF-1-like protein, putative [Bodo saltans]|uniref:DGF-1-like protein, putative n=1 Tax=Bodo saltans TaxID=75058 RepID=A0A0S4J8T1_BODSA|nr:DGF-1-like protein, putative [Bodo saltans]|eukprot:CUG87665.1 DGF-1-like protein, putative [Bodo saltans]
MIGLLSCSGSTPALQSAGYFVSLFFNLGPAAVGAGNVGLIGAVFVLHYAAVRVWMRYKKITDETEAMADLRFPALAVFLAMYLLPGAVYGGVVCVSSNQDAAVGGLVLLVVAVLVVASQVFLVRRILPTCEFVPYAADYPSAFAFERLALLPTSHWAPEYVERRFMPLLGTRTKQWCLLSIADVLLALVLSAATGLGVGTSGASCSVMPVVVAVFYFANAALIIIFVPHRRPMDRVAFPIIWTVSVQVCECR